ncbi:hypothetical protein, partial [Luteimonas salinisoli]|uniref:hypothetical protein n=1 Tax=Luteimonas salinisoli TaxID=2752307 RepID=UPI001C5C988E
RAGRARPGARRRRLAGAGHGDPCPDSDGRVRTGVRLARYDAGSPSGNRIMPRRILSASGRPDPDFGGMG